MYFRRGLAAASLAVGCARPTIPDPAVAARAYAEAAERGDADAIYELMTSEAQRTYGREETRRLVAQARSELRSQGAALRSDQTASRATATVRYSDGEQAELVVEKGQLKIASAAGLPAEAATPGQALIELRQALARRSYAGLLRVLSEETRSTLEGDLRSLVEGLEDPETLDIVVEGDQAVVEVPGGHSVRLKRVAGSWKVEDFD